VEKEADTNLSSEGRQVEEKEGGQVTYVGSREISQLEDSPFPDFFLRFYHREREAEGVGSEDSPMLEEGETLSNLCSGR